MNEALSEPERNGSSAISTSDVAGRDHRCHDRRATVVREGVELVLGQLDTAARAVVADAEHAVAERLHRELGAVDLREHDGIHFGAVRNARRETR